VTTWETNTLSDPDWDALLRSLGHHSPFSTSGWARTKTGGKWSILRASQHEGDKVVAAMQVQYYRLPGGTILGWVPGGIAGRESAQLDGISTWLRKATNGRMVYLRCAFHLPHNERDESALLNASWSQCTRFIGAHETFLLTPTNGVLADTRRLTSNWRRNLQRGLDRNCDATNWTHPDPVEIAALSQEMIKFKRSQGPKSVDDACSLSLLLSEMSDHLVTVQVRDKSGQLLAVRAAFVVGDSAWDAIAAAGKDARQKYSSYACAWKLLTELDSRNVSLFDLAGIDEVTNEGVFNFKKGLGGQRTVYLGEWDWASSSFVRKVARLLVSRLG
jgi:hypothetical protein